MAYSALWSGRDRNDDGLSLLSERPAFEKPRILHVTECLSTGVLTAMATLCHELNDRFAFTILYGRRWETPTDAEAMFPPGTAFHPWTVARSLNPFKDATALRQLLRTAREVRPDLIHAHSSKAGALVRLAFPHGSPAVAYTPHCYAFLRNDGSRLSNRAVWALEWLLGRTAHTTVAIGANEFAHSRRVARRATLIPNMVPILQPSIAQPSEPDAGLRPRGGDGRRLLVVGVGSIRPQKNFPLFCEVARRFDGDEVEFQWLGAGMVPDGCVVPDNVTITGWLPHERVIETLHAADVFLQTSAWEGLPISVLEAMSSGLPLVVTPAEGNRELVSSFVNGFLCDTADEFSGAIRLLRDHAAIRAMLGQGSRQRAADYSVGRLAERWAAFYSAEIGGRAAVAQAAVP